MKNPTSVLRPFRFHPTLDTKFLGGIFESDPENARYIFELFLEELPSTVQSINCELGKNNKSELYEVIHKTKTSFSFVGLTFITALMEDIEKQCILVHEAKELKEGLKYLLHEINESTPLIKKEYSRLTHYTKNLFENQLHYC